MPGCRMVPHRARRMQRRERFAALRRRPLMQERSLDTTTSLGLLVLRLGFGGYMASHGLGKLAMLRAGQSEMMGDPIGIGPLPSLVLVMFAEFACALLVLMGLATRFAAIPIVFAMGVAAFVAHGADPWSSETAAKAFFAGTSKVWFSKEPALLFL